MFEKLTVRQAQRLSRMLSEAYDRSMRISKDVARAHKACTDIQPFHQCLVFGMDQARMRQEFTMLRWDLADRIAHV